MSESPIQLNPDAAGVADILSLSHPITPLVGRAGEIADVLALLRTPTVRLLTLTGPGGVGKSRLASRASDEVRREFPDGVWAVSLAPLHDAELLLPRIAQRFGLRETSERSVADALQAHLAVRRLLLVLDNFEHLLDAAPALPQLLAGAPGITILTTSRSPLHLALSGEHQFPVPPLAVPPPRAASTANRSVADIAAFPAVELFAQRARAVRPGFAVTGANADTVAEICRRLDGLPLAIELAAVRSRVLSPAALLARLTHRFDVLTSAEGGVPERHRTLREAIAWSHDLLSPEEQVVFRCLAVFAGPFASDAARAVSIGDGGVIPRTAPIEDVLGALIDQSLLQVNPEPGNRFEDGPRFSMLESVREYARERLNASGDEPGCGRRHAAFYLAIADQERSVPRHEWLLRLDADTDNLRAALGWAVASADGETALRLAVVLGRFWEIRGTISEGRVWLEKAMGAAGVRHARLRSNALAASSRFAEKQGDIDAATRHAEEALRLARQDGDTAAIALALRTMGGVCSWRGDYSAGITHIEEALARYRALDDQPNVAYTLYNLGNVLWWRDGDDRAVATIQASLALHRELKDDWGCLKGSLQLAFAEKTRGNVEPAANGFREALGLGLQLGDAMCVSQRLDGLAELAIIGGQPTEAVRFAAAADALRQSIGQTRLPAAERAGIDRTIASATRSLSPDAFARAWAFGAATAPRDLVSGSIGSETPPSPLFGLTPREHEVVALLAKGMTDREIGDALFVTRRTAAAHVASILAKLVVPSRAAAAAEAVRRGLV